MITQDAYLTGLGKLINVTAVTDLLNGRVIKGPKREDGTKYPCVTLFASTSDVGNETTLQTFEATINIWVASKKNGAADLNALSQVEAQIVPLIRSNGWSNGTTACLQQNFRGTQGPFHDPLESDVHFSSIQVRSHMVDLS